MDTLEAIRALPKVELHVHILGSIQPETLLSIIREDGISAPYSNVEEIGNRFEYTDFMNFIRTYMEIVEYITDARHFERITYEMLETCSKSNVQYVEASFSPRDHLPNNLDFKDMVNAINQGIQRAQHDFDIETNIRIDVVRTSSSEEATEILDLIERNPDNIISIDIGGNEREYPPQPFAEIYERARGMGLHCVAHAGEAAGPESIWGALHHLKVERIGHGITARGNPDLIEHLKQNKIAIEMCPVSNLRTGVVPSISEHPIREFFEKGLLVTVNSDDPSLFHTSMNNEYEQIHKHLDFSLKELFQISMNGVQTAFINESVKSDLVQRFTKEFTEIESQVSG